MLVQVSWKDLPLELLGKIASGRKELGAMKEVCKSWRSGFQNSITRITVRVPVPHPEPIPGILRFGGLRTLRLYGDVSNLNLRALRGSSVRELELGCSDGDLLKFMSTLKGAPLTSVSLLEGFPTLTDAYIEVLKGLPLTKLSLGQMRGENHFYSATSSGAAEVTGRGFEHLGTFSQLNHLTLVHIIPKFVSPSDFSALRGLPLRTLKFATVNDLTSEEAQNPEAVELFDLGSVFRELRGVPLTDLWVTDGLQELSDGGLRALKDMPFTNLRLDDYGTISDEGMLCLRGMPLTALRLGIHDIDRFSHTRRPGPQILDVSEVGLRALQGMPLTFLSLVGDWVLGDATFRVASGKMLCGGCQSSAWT